MITHTLARAFAPKTIPTPECAQGVEGVRMRIDAHEPGPARDAYACVMRECGTGAMCRDEVPFYRLRAWALVMLGFAIGGAFGMAMGANAVPPRPASVSAEVAP